MPCSEEHKEKISKYMRNRVVSGSTREKLSKAFQGSRSKFAKIDESVAYNIKCMLISGKTPKDIAKDLNVGYQTVTAIRANKTWRHVDICGWNEWLDSRI